MSVVSERESSLDGDNQLRHQQSVSSDLGLRALVPMWDSSDPERAPPPLPLNPQSPPRFVSRAGTSSAIQSAHAALSERVKESSGKRMSDHSPDRGLPKSGAHRRMQSLQPGSVRDLSMMLQGPNGASVAPPKSPEKSQRPSTPVRSRDSFSSEPRHIDLQSTSSTPGPSLTPIVRPVVRRFPAQSSILGENTPPQSSTMLALQNMGHSTSSNGSVTNGVYTKEADPALSNITNGAKPPLFENLSTQILGLTSIATQLQKEMSQLSRRSKDNAADLMSLKEATSTRDEDIRRSLRDLLANMHEQREKAAARDSLGGPYNDGKPHIISPDATRPFHLPRIPSLKSFADSLDRASISTPSLAGSEAGPSLAILEKIIRDMGTKEGQENLVGQLAEISDKLGGVATVAMIEELSEYVRAQPHRGMFTNHVEEPRGRPRNLSFDEEGSGMELAFNTPAAIAQAEQFMRNEGRRPSEPLGRGADVLNNELINIIHSVKDSVAQGGGLTAEVKALVRELRGEVLGMGREIGRRLDERAGGKGDTDEDPPDKDDIAHVIDEGLEQMKEQLDNILSEHRRESINSLASHKTIVDYQEIYNAMRAALRDNDTAKANMPDMNREEVIEAVREAWENYKPEVGAHNIGLEREEVLACLKEGLQEYKGSGGHSQGVTKDEVHEAVVEGLKHFSPPHMDTAASLSRDEIIEAVRDCLEEFEFPVAASAVGHGDLTREDMVRAVREGLHDMELPTTRALAAPPDNDEVISRLREMMQYMKSEIAPVSREGNLIGGANGSDAVRIIGATKEGLENLRVAIESYVARATGRAGQEDFLDDMMKSLDEFKEEISELVAGATESSREQLKTELEGLREIVNSSMVPATPRNVAPMGNNLEIIEALHNGLNSLRQEIHRPRPETSEMLDALNDGLNDIRAGIDRVSNKPMDLTANDEILEALRSGLDSVREDIEALRESGGGNVTVAHKVSPTSNNEVLDTLKSGLQSLRSDIESLRDSPDIKATDSAAGGPSSEAHKELQTALRTGLESISTALVALRDTVSGRAAPASDVVANEEVLTALKTGLESLRTEMQSIRDSNGERAITALDGAPSTSDQTLEDVKSGLDALRSDIESLHQSSADKAVGPGSNEELLEALKAGLDSVRADIQTLRDGSSEDAVTAVGESTTNDKLLDALQTGLDALRADIESLRESGNEHALAALAKQSEQPAADSLKQDDIKNLESLISQVQSRVDSMPPTVPKDDFKRMEDTLRKVQRVVDEVSHRKPSLVVARDVTDNDVEIASREDVEAIETILRNTKDRLDDLMDGEQAIRKDHIDAVESLVLEAKDSLSTINEQMELVSRKDVLEALVGQITTEFQEIRERAIKESDNPDKVLKADVEGVQAALLEIKTALDGMAANELASLSTKEEVAKLEVAIGEINQKLEESKESSVKTIALLEESNASSYQAIAIRDADMATVGERVTEVKSFLVEFQDTVRSKLDDGSSGIEVLSKMLQTMGEAIEKNENVGSDLNTMFETMKAEFEDSKGIAVSARLESDEKVQQATDNLGAKMEEKIGELIAKYDEFQVMIDERGKLSDARDAETSAVAIGTKEIADELKLLIDTLGSTVTDSLEKMEEASKTVFERVEALVTKTDENHTSSKDDHQQTRDQLSQTLTLLEGLKGEVGENHPQLVEAVKNVLLLVGEHFEHTKTSVTELQGKIEEGQPTEHMRNILPPEKYDNTEVLEKVTRILDEKYDDSVVREQLEKIIEQRYDDTEVRGKVDKIIEDKYDDAPVHEKLDKLYAEKYDDATAQAKLDHIIADKYDDAEVQTKLNTIIEEKYDDAAVQQKLDQLVEGKYDDTEVRDKLDKIIGDKYDDILVHEKLDKLAADKYDDAAVREKLDKLREDKYDDAVVQTKLDKIIDDRYDDILVHEKLDKVIEEKYDDILVHEKLDKIIEEKYDDGVVQSKLDKLVDHTDVAEKAFTQLSTLEQVRESMIKAAAEISLILANQNQRIADDKEEREKSLQETNLALERKLAEKEHAEASVLSLKDEEERLRQSVLDLRTEQESLIRQKTRLTGDLSSLETAMRLRKEELSDMESRAEGLERRILEGVMDHSRVLLMSKVRRAGGDAMNRKRVRKPANEGEAPKSAVNAALAAKRNMASATHPASGRRIVSLSQINSNIASSAVKRSQSVKTPAASIKTYRKSSWNGLDKSIDEDKENMGLKEPVEELDEPETPMTNSAGGDVTNDAGAGRRESNDTTVVTKDDETDSGSESGSEYEEESSEMTETAGEGEGETKPAEVVA